MQILPVALENFMAADMHHHIQITRRRTVGAGLPFPRQTNRLLVIDARRNIDFQRFSAFHAAVAMAFDTWLFDFPAGAAASVTGLLQLENCLPHMDNAGAAASRTGGSRSTGLGTGAVTDIALFMRRNGNAFLNTGSGLFQRNFDIVTQIFPLEALLARSSAAAEHLAENIAEIEACAAKTAESSGTAIHTGLAELVVAAAFFAVGQNIVCFLDGFKLFFRLFIVGVAVGVVLHGQFAVGAFDFLIGSITGHP